MRDELRPEFWRTLPLHELNSLEWEALCDGCGRCCLHKLQDENSAELVYTGVACQYLDIERCQCKDYSQRLSLAADCIDVRSALGDGSLTLSNLPASCAYRLRGEDKPLYDWHPLISGDGAQIHSDNISVRGKVLSAEYVHDDDFEDHVINWVEL